MSVSCWSWASPSEEDVAAPAVWKLKWKKWRSPLAPKTKRNRKSANKLLQQLYGLRFWQIDKDNNKNKILVLFRCSNRTRPLVGWSAIFLVYNCVFKCSNLVQSQGHSLVPTQRHPSTWEAAERRRASNPPNAKPIPHLLSSEFCACGTHSWNIGRGSGCGGSRSGVG